MSITFNQQSHCINHRVIKTENIVTVPSNSISLRTKFKKKCRKHRSLSFKSRAVPIIK